MTAEHRQFSSAITEAANRAEATALLIRCGYRVYRPEADIFGEDLVVLPPNGQLHGVQLKGRPTVDLPKYGHRTLWMLFPSAPYRGSAAREWFLVPHDGFYEWVKNRHGHAPKWDDKWSYPFLSKGLSDFLVPYKLLPRTENPNDRFIWSEGDLEIIDPE